MDSMKQPRISRNTTTISMKRARLSVKLRIPLEMVRGILVKVSVQLSREAAEVMNMTCAAAMALSLMMRGMSLSFSSL